MSQAQVRIDPTTLGAELPSALFGTFVEHLGRAVYDGIYEPGHPSAGADGFREDVLELIRDLGPTMVRYPGGNFVSGYCWEDGVGPDRPVRLDAAWHSLEPNTVGLHEFAAWAERAGLELVEAVNLGTRGMQEAAALVEYANHPGGTTRSEQRRAHGRAEPFGIRTWCLGNEMDGPWQIGHKTADEYGRLAAETARLMRLVDPDIELVVAGSSAHDLPTFGDWERTVLRHTIGLIDLISLHAYYEERDGDTIGFLASGRRLEEQICAVAAIIDQVAAETGQPAPRIAVDEWNVWRMSAWLEQQDTSTRGAWRQAPPLLEDTYDVTDAVVVGGLLISLIRSSSLVSMANLAQLVNVIAPIRTEPGGPAWRQTTYFPFQLAARHARGRLAGTAVTSPTLHSTLLGSVEALDAVATVDDNGRVKLFVAHRGINEALPVQVRLTGSWSLAEAHVVAAPADGDRRTTNGPGAERVTTAPLPVSVDVTGAHTDVGMRLPAPSWAVVALEQEPG